MNVQDIKLEGMRILEGTHDLLEEVKYAIEQKLNLSDYSDMVRPVVLNFTLKSATIVQYTIKGRFMSR